jgi:hypothetical protein
MLQNLIQGPRQVRTIRRENTEYRTSLAILLSGTNIVQVTGGEECT